MSGWPVDVLKHVRSGHTVMVDENLADDIATLYNRLDGRTGTSPTSARHAAAQDWLHRDDWTPTSLDLPPVQAVTAAHRRPPAPLWTADPQLVLDVVHGAAALHDLPPQHRWIPVRSLRSAGYPLDVIAVRVLASLDDVLAALDAAQDRPPGGTHRPGQDRAPRPDGDA